MRRDMDLIRQILLEIEEHSGNAENLYIKGYSHEQIAYHVYLLHDAGLVKAKILYGMGSVNPVSYTVFSMTWMGHEFLDACRDEGIWQKMKEIVEEQVKSAPFKILKGVLFKLVESKVSLAIQ